MPPQRRPLSKYTQLRQLLSKGVPTKPPAAVPFRFPSPSSWAALSVEQQYTLIMKARHLGCLRDLSLEASGAFAQAGFLRPKFFKWLAFLRMHSFPTFSHKTPTRFTRFESFPTHANLTISTPEGHVAFFSLSVYGNATSFVFDGNVARTQQFSIRTLFQ